MELSRRDNQRVIRASRGTRLEARSWQTEAPLRMLMNNLDAEVAESPQELVVYGGIGRAARDWPLRASVLRRLRCRAGLWSSSGSVGYWPPAIFRSAPENLDRK